MPASTDWQALRVFRAWGSEYTGLTLGQVVAWHSEWLAGATIAGGAITAWYGYLLAAPGEAPSASTPAGAVTWTGFTAAVGGKGYAVPVAPATPTAA